MSGDFISEEVSNILNTIYSIYREILQSYLLQDHMV